MSPLRQKFINYLKLRGLAEITIKHYVRSVSLCSRFFNKPPLALSREEVEKFLLHLKDVRKLTPKTINQILYSLKSFYNHFTPQNNFMDSFRRMKEPRKLLQVLSKEEIERLIDASPDLRVKALIALIYSSGIRVGECTKLKISDIDKDREVIKVISGKGAKDRNATLSSRALIILREYYKQYRPKEWLFENRAKTHSLSKRRIQYFIQHAGELARINKHITPHILRHSVATHMLEEGVPIQVVQAFLGHSNISTTTQYSHVSTELLKSVGSPFDKQKGVANA